MSCLLGVLHFRFMRHYNIPSKAQSRCLSKCSGPNRTSGQSDREARLAIITINCLRGTLHCAEFGVLPMFVRRTRRLGLVRCPARLHLEFWTYCKALRKLRFPVESSPIEKRLICGPEGRGLRRQLPCMHGVAHLNQHLQKILVVCWRFQPHAFLCLESSRRLPTR